jgi:DNA recombination protein RmuC
VALSFKLAVTWRASKGERGVFGLGVSWLVVGVCLVIVQGAGAALYWQILKQREARANLHASQTKLEYLQMRVHQQEDEIRELTAGLRAERAHVEQLKRQLEFAQGQAMQMRHDS